MLMIRFTIFPINPMMTRANRRVLRICVERQRNSFSLLVLGEQNRIHLKSFMKDVFFD